MAFESLTDKLQNIFKRLRSKGRLSEDDVKAAMKEVRMALLEADVNFRVVKDFVKKVQERAVGSDVLGGLNPAQTVIKIVNDEMSNLLGSQTSEIVYRPGRELTIILLAGLQGAGKTTMAAKLAGQMKKKGKSVLLAACDVYRPAAIEQLQRNAQKVDVPVFSLGDQADPVDIAVSAEAQAKKEGDDVLILDTAGRLQVDQALMQELSRMKTSLEVTDTLLVLDAMTGQEAVNVAKAFDETIGIDGVILTKLDSDTRGGAALSVRAVTNKPILYTGTGEKMTDIEAFHPDRMASRILGMGDVLSVIEKAQESIDEEEARQLQRKVRKNEFDFDMYLDSLRQMNKMGGIESVLSMFPGAGQQMRSVDTDEAEKSLRHTEAIICSMTPQERKNPSLLNPSRKYRIAKGAGVDIAEVNRFLKQFDQTKKMMKQFGGKGGRRRHGGMGLTKGMPF